VVGGGAPVVGAEVPVAVAEPVPSEPPVSDTSDVAAVPSLPRLVIPDPELPIVFVADVPLPSSPHAHNSSDAQPRIHHFSILIINPLAHSPP